MRGARIERDKSWLLWDCQSNTMIFMTSNHQLKFHNRAFVQKETSAAVQANQRPYFESTLKLLKQLESVLVPVFWLLLSCSWRPTLSWSSYWQRSNVSSGTKEQRALAGWSASFKHLQMHSCGEWGRSGRIVCWSWRQAWGRREKDCIHFLFIEHGKGSFEYLKT